MINNSCVKKFCLNLNTDFLELEMTQVLKNIYVCYEKEIEYFKFEENS